MDASKSNALLGEDYGEIRITPNIADRVNLHKRLKAEREAEHNLAVALQTIRENAELRAELARVKAASSRVMCDAWAVAGYPQRLAIAAPVV